MDDRRALVNALVWCRRHPDGVRPAFRSRDGWETFLTALHEVLDEEAEGSAPAPELDTVEAATLYQTLYWIARTAAVPTPDTDLLHVTAAGWAAIPAIVHKALHGTPILLTEHGVYVRESYLAAARSRSRPAGASSRHGSPAAWRSPPTMPPTSCRPSPRPTRGGLSRWALTPQRCRSIHNGVERAGRPHAPPGASRVVAVGRIDPLKDVHTMLRVAVEVTRRLPDARFLYYGPVTAEQEAYGQSCYDLHGQLGLGELFRFMG